MKPRAGWAAPCTVGALLAGFGAADPAFAQGFSLSGFVSETLDYTQNPGLAAVSPGSSLTSSTSLGLTLSSATEVSTFSLAGSTYLFLARNPDGSVSREYGYPTISMSYSDTTSRRSVTLGASYRVAPAGDGSTFIVDDIDDDGVIEPGEVTVLLTDARQITTGLTASYVTELTARDTVRITARASWVDFDGNDPELIPSERQSVRLNWRRQLTEDLSGGLNLSGAFFRNEAIPATESTTTSLTGNVSYQATRLMSLSADLGLQHTVVDDGTGTTSTDGVTGGASLDYELADGGFGLDIGFGVEPSDGGSLRQNLSLGADYNRTINSVSSLAVALDLSIDGDVGDAIGSGTRRISVSPSYSHQLTDDISARLGYRFEHVSGGGTDATSHGIFAGVTKNFDFLK